MSDFIAFSSAFLIQNASVDRSQDVSAVARASSRKALQVELPGGRSAR